MFSNQIIFLLLICGKTHKSLQGFLVCKAVGIKGVVEMDHCCGIREMAEAMHACIDLPSTGFSSNLIEQDTLESCHSQTGSSAITVRKSNMYRFECDSQTGKVFANMINER